MLDKFGLSRRSLLAGASLIAAGEITGRVRPALAKGVLPPAQAPAFYRFQIGDIDAAIVSDGELSLGPARTDMFNGISQDLIDTTLTDNFLSSQNLVLQENALLLNSGGKLVLFDVGSGTSKAFGPNAGRIAENLKTLGVARGDIDAIVLTHAHPDHCWGLVADDGSLNFPNAQIFVSEADYNFWTDEAKISQPFIGDFIPPTRKQLVPNRERITFIKDGAEIVPGVVAMFAPGHTVGHTIFMVTSGSKTLCVTADLAHHHLLTLANPKVEFGFDTDRKQGAATRIRVFDTLVANRTPMLAYHFPWPGIGHLVKQGDGYRFIAVPQQTVL